MFPSSAAKQFVSFILLVSDFFVFQYSVARVVAAFMKQCAPFDPLSNLNTIHPFRLAIPLFRTFLVRLTRAYAHAVTDIISLSDHFPYPYPIRESTPRYSLDR